MLLQYIAVAAVAATAAAQRPDNTSICDFYTTALLKNNTAANQLTLLTLVVNTAVIGNYTQPNVGIKVPGILAPGEFNGTAVDLAQYFDGALASTNTGGNNGSSVNFLDGGGATPLMANKAANDTSSNQFNLLTHLYEYFGGLLGCTMMGGNDFPAYGGQSSMYEVHKFMDLSQAEVGYFISQVAASAASFGVADSDLTIVGNALSSTFGFMCSPPAAVVTKDTQLQAICIGDGCPTSPNATCAAYAAAVEPTTAISSLIPTSTASVTGSATAPASASAAASSASASASSQSASASGATTATPSATTGTSGAANTAVVGLTSFIVLTGTLVALLL